MPFGKANSSKVFCTWTTAWRKSFHIHFQKFYSVPIALSSYVDDFFGGPIRTDCLETDKKNAELLLKNLISIGDLKKHAYESSEMPAGRQVHEHIRNRL